MYWAHNYGVDNSKVKDGNYNTWDITLYTMRKTVRFSFSHIIHNFTILHTHILIFDFGFDFDLVPSSTLRSST